MTIHEFLEDIDFVLHLNGLEGWNKNHRMGPIKLDWFNPKWSIGIFVEHGAKKLNRKLDYKVVIVKKSDYDNNPVETLEKMIGEILEHFRKILSILHRDD